MITTTPIRNQFYKFKEKTRKQGGIVFLRRKLKLDTFGAGRGWRALFSHLKPNLYYIKNKQAFYFKQEILCYKVIVLFLWSFSIWEKLEENPVSLAVNHVLYTSCFQSWATWQFSTTSRLASNWLTYSYLPSARPSYRVKYWLKLTIHRLSPLQLSRCRRKLSWRPAAVCVHCKA